MAPIIVDNCHGVMGLASRARQRDSTCQSNDEHPRAARVVRETMQLRGRDTHTKHRRNTIAGNFR